MHGIGFARELKQQLEARFRKKGTDNKLRRMANYLAPQFRGIHLDEMNALEDTKNKIELESARITPENNQPLVHDNTVAEEVECDCHFELPDGGDNVGSPAKARQDVEAQGSQDRRRMKSSGPNRAQQKSTKGISMTWMQ